MRTEHHKLSPHLAARRGGPWLFVLLAAACLGLLSPAWAYIGPGAGMVFLSSFLALFVAFVVGFLLIGLSLLRFVLGLFRRRRRSNAQARRVVVIGFDGCDPQIAERLMNDGLLPNLKALAEDGSYHHLRTTCPPISPVAWATFATGTNPGKHNIYDFLRRNAGTYQPQLSSTDLRGRGRSLRIGSYCLPLGGRAVQLLRKSKPFWEVLGESGIFSAVMRVPISYPPTRFRGLSLAGLCAPDLLGTQGTFALYTTDADELRTYESGLAQPFERDNGLLRAEIRGPGNPLRPDAGPMTLPMSLRVDREANGAELRVGSDVVRLTVGEYSDWVTLVFRAGLWVKARGMCRFRLLSIEPEVRLYQSPIHIDPRAPATPISHPAILATYLAKLHGPYGTLGLAEDTWALNEGILTPGAFLDQCDLFHHERRRLFYDVLSKTRQGLFVGVFDLTDRVQHMFLGEGNGREDGFIPEAVQQAYRTMDEVVGEVRDGLDDDAVLFVMSDHGFGPFTRCFDLNRWLCENGYLVLKEAPGRANALAEVDWERTRAYALGLNGLYLNLRGRERHGIVEPGTEAETLELELAAGLAAFIDPETGTHPVRETFSSGDIYSGPYTRDAPDLIVGYERGYRVSWDSVVGKIADGIVFDNPKAWAADHCIHPDEVPGVLFCSHKIDNERPWIGDIAPTILQLLGVPVPRYMDGKPLELQDEPHRTEGRDERAA